MNYNETTIANKLTSNNINIRTGNNLNSVSTIINDTTIDTVDTLINIANNSSNNTTKLNLNIGNGIGIALAEERHEHEHIHDTWGGDIGRAALGGAITGLASGIGIKGGEFLGKLAGNAFSDLVSSSLSKSMTQALTASVNASVNAATMSTMNTVGTAMANTTIYGGNFKDVLKSGRDSLRDKDNLKSIAVSTLGAGITTGITTKLNIVKPTTFTDKLTKNAIDGATNTALQSTINGDSFKDTLKHQVVNTLVMTGAEYGANAIGDAYKNNNINKFNQLSLHAGLGAVSSKLTGGDYLSGAISGVVGEVAGEYFKNKGYNRDDGSELAGLVSGLSSIIVSKASGDDVNEISKNAYAGQRVGQNAAENNSYFVNKNKKSVVVIDDGDYNAYVVDNDVSREEIEQNPENYKDKSILYSDVFLDGDKKLSGDDLTLAEKSFNNEEVHNELLLLDSFDKNKSISENISNLLSDGKIDTQTASNLQRALNNGADDFSLSYLMANNLWSGIADNSYGISYPTQTMTDSFNINIEYRDIINPAIGQEVRTLENGNCRTAGCGEKGSARSDHTHNGTDILLNEGGYVVAPIDGTLYYTGSNRKPEKSLPSGAIENENDRILMLYIDIDKNLNIDKNGTEGIEVRQGGVIGKGTSNSEFIRVYGNNTPQHTHVEQQSPTNRKDRKDIQSTLFPKQQRELKK